jgi:hypothetical protein
MPTKRSTQKRDLVRGKSANFFTKRESNGRFKEMDEVGRSLSADRRRSSKTKVRSGHGDQGDR